MSLRLEANYTGREKLILDEKDLAKQIKWEKVTTRPVHLRQSCHLRSLCFDNHCNRLSLPLEKD